MLFANTQKLVKSLQRPFVVITRSFSAAPLTDPLEDDSVIPARSPPHADCKISKLENGVKVASCDGGGGVSRINVVVPAGSRFESKDQLGLSHIMKNAAFLTNNGRSHLRTVRETQQVGGFLESSNSRELLTRKAGFLRNKLPAVLENVAPGITSPIFNSWDVPQVKAQCKSDIATLDGAAVNIELLHRAAFRTGLGNSIYCDGLKINTITGEQMAAFANQIYVGEGVSIIGTDVDHDELMRYSKDLFGGLPSGPAPSAPAQQYHGGETHVHTCNGLTYASIVGNGVGMFDADLPAYAVLQRILGSGPLIKWGSHTVSSKLNQATMAVTQEPHMVSSLNLSYSDAGLFGLHTITAPQDAAPVLKAAINGFGQIAAGELSAEEVEQAKNQTKSNILMLSESNEEYLDDLTRQVISSGSYTAPAETLKLIDGVTVENIVEVAKKLFAGNPTLVVTGDVTHAPYLDELL